MPNIKSAAKRMRQSAKRRTANRTQRAAMRTAIKKARLVISEGNAEAIPAQLKATVSSVDKAARKGLIHKNKAARHASRLAKAANAAAKA